MALGDIHPETRVEILDEWPDFKPVQRNALKSGANGVLAESSKGNIISGPMDAFVSRELAFPSDSERRSSYSYRQESRPP